MQKSDHPKNNWGEDIAFGIQQTAACWATDFIDPFVSAWIQKKVGDKNQTQTLQHALKGEIVGDSTAFFTFIAIQKWAPSTTQWIAKQTYQHANKILDPMARTKIADWANRHKVVAGDAAYDHKLEEYKQFQANNFARSTVISLGSIVSNVAVQRWSGNKNSLATITLSKAVGAGITMGVVMGSRITFPDTARTLDREMDRRLISPMIRHTQALLGTTPTPPEIESSHRERLEKQSSATTTNRQQDTQR